MDRKIVYLIIILFCLVNILTHGQTTTEDTTSWYKIAYDRNDSGAVALAMLIERSGPATTVEQVKNQLPTNYTINNMLSVLKTYDIDFRYLNRISDWDENGVLLVLINPSSFAPYDYDGLHYIIITGIHNEYYVVNDSFIGIYQRYYKQLDMNRARYWYIIQVF